ncbi:hypothetical protein VNO77_25760 [Canavalia gladiata]|uniref:Uncharacterized protein n=1 Tax=Canavalia gladiata TaxID=3824 RepID=A0AAN9KSK1_CANGL
MYQPLEAKLRPLNHSNHCINPNNKIDPRWQWLYMPPPYIKSFHLQWGLMNDAAKDEDEGRLRKWNMVMVFSDLYGATLL